MHGSSGILSQQEGIPLLFMNMAAGMQKEISHEEVQESSDESSKNFAVLVSGLLSKMP